VSTIRARQPGDDEDVIAVVQITVRRGDKVRTGTGRLLRIVDVTLGGELVGLRGRTSYVLRNGEHVAVDDISEWRRGGR
jgi:hypothetical protein